MDNIFDLDDYKLWVLKRMEAEKPNRGARSRLAQSIQCHLAYIPQVLNGFVHFTPEQAERVCQHFGLGESEADYFITLVQRDRAGTPSLKDYYQKKINKIQESRAKVSSRIQIKHKIGLKEQVQYYSSWHYIATYVLTSIQKFNTEKAIAERLQIPIARANEILSFLVAIGMLKYSGNHYKIAKTRLHLPNTSPLISKHHTNWRIKAIESLDKPFENGSVAPLHYSTVYSLSKDDMVKIRKQLLSLIENIEPVIAKSPEEIACCLSFDWFEI